MKPEPLGYRYPPPSPWNPDFRAFRSPDEHDPFFPGDPGPDFDETFIDGPAKRENFFDELDQAVLGREKQPEPGRFIWETDDGEFLYLSEMATKHLFYTLRMLFNHSVPPAFRVGWCPKNRHEKVFHWSVEYREQAIRKIFHELTEHRDDLDSDLKEELDDIQRNATAIKAIGI